MCVFVFVIVFVLGFVFAQRVFITLLFFGSVTYQFAATLSSGLVTKVFMSVCECECVCVCVCVCVCMCVCKTLFFVFACLFVSFSVCRLVVSVCM
jgi:hypothetical protein